MRSEAEGRLRAQSSAGGGNSPAAPPGAYRARQAAQCPNRSCLSFNTFMYSGGNGPTSRYHKCHECGETFKAVSV